MSASSGLVISDYSVHDVRFPTSLTGDGTDAMNTTCDYSAAYLVLYTAPPGTKRSQPPRSTPSDDASKPLTGYGMTFTIGKGNEICCSAISSLVEGLLLGREVESLFSNMGKAWELLVSDPQLRWIGPEKGVIHLATAAAVNALWDLFARSRGKPLWRLVADMSPEELVKCVPFRYITDAITPEEALKIFQDAQAGKQERIEEMIKDGYPAYTTSAGWSGYDDAKVARLTRSALAQGFNHFKLKVGASLEDDKRRLSLLRSIVDDPKEMPGGRIAPTAASISGKNAGPTGCVVMVDANQVWDVSQAIDYMKELAYLKPWFIEEPTAPDDVLGHAAIRKALKPFSIGVATGEHSHNRMNFKQLLQADAVDVVQIDSCRLAGVNEVLSVLLMAKKFGKIVCPHAGGVGLCEYVVHLSLIDYICVSATHERNVLEWVDHLHEHFVYPVSINSGGRYRAPVDAEGGYSIEMLQSSVEDYSFPNGSYWKSGEARTAPPSAH
ncbi:enolase C-terminal domain-like protein [Violaceomyces palustris]|uniref:Enolase C-terminal domain-like protein n=1 Tax=Violaceomyces palustris TaxID=1673888 RepID=A0ACD0NQ02_9BASI|nr:enolase C-terminal domain-like protein [Violaceomyces palustris]